MRTLQLTPNLAHLFRAGHSKLRQGILLALIMALVGSRGVVTAQQTSGASLQDGIINLAHLQFLTEPISVNGRDMAIVHVYSENPKYQWVDAAGEGISALDDVARATIVYLAYYERTGNQQALDLARRCLNFVLYMQANDGEFYNFVTDSAATINQTGSTSYKSLGWWAMRGMWALADGVRVFDKIDRSFADELAKAYLKTEKVLAATIRPDRQTNSLHGFDIPGWFGGSADVASVGLLALTRYEQARPNDTTAALMTALGDGIAAYRLGDTRTYPFGMHPVTANAPGYWHDWGAHMVQALAAAGSVLHKSAWIASAAADADSFLVRQLAFERIRESGVLPNHLGQIAYGTNMLVQGFAEVARATGDSKYWQYAGLAAAWFFGDNIAGVAMYDPATGRTYDGIQGSAAWRVNLNAGAESTIEGLTALLTVTGNPTAQHYLDFKTVTSTPYVIAEAETGTPTGGNPGYKGGTWTGEAYYSNDHYEELKRGDSFDLPFNLPTDSDYVIYVAHVRHAGAETPLHLEAIRATTPPTLDGKLDEWAKVPAFAVNKPSQLLRGVSQWPGADKASFKLRVLWDDQNLYLAIEVQAPTPHNQPEVGPGVWHYDAMWVYMDTTGQGTRIDSKFTLAQTPKGPQVWDWKASFFMPKAQLAWSSSVDGLQYIYEAAIPFKSLRARPPQEGMTLGIQVGRGWGGDSFMDLNGTDPDTPTNLIPITLVLHANDTAASVTPSAASADPFGTAINVGVDGGKPMMLAENTSPDRAFLWLDALNAVPIPLKQGPHLLHIAYSGNSADGSSQIDGFLIQPVTATKIMQNATGQRIELVFDTRRGSFTVEELPF